jgi:hypothetical protein
MADFDSFVQQLLSDPSLCEKLVANPEATLKAHGVDATPAMVDALKGLDAAAVQRLVAAFGQQKAAAA